jgi:hypothetical protein
LFTPPTAVLEQSLFPAITCDDGNGIFGHARQCCARPFSRSPAHGVEPPVLTAHSESPPALVGHAARLSLPSAHRARRPPADSTTSSVAWPGATARWARGGQSRSILGVVRP